MAVGKGSMARASRAAKKAEGAQDTAVKRKTAQKTAQTPARTEKNFVAIGDEMPIYYY